MRRFRSIVAAASAATLAATLAACSSAGASGGPVTLQYWLWDDTQQPAYQQCATDFHQQNPDIDVKITQYAWSNYWTNLTTQLAAGSAPDVWVDQSSYYPQFVQDKQIVDLQPYLDKDKSVDLNAYTEGLADVWKVGDARYGLPKDWDTMGLVYRKDDLKKAGLTEKDLRDLTWNPTDGGTFGKVIAQLTTDKSGRDGLDPAFDKGQVKTYGFLPEWADGSQGQNGWGNLAASLGWTYADKNPFGTTFNYDDPKLVSTISWLAGLSGKGYAPKFSAQSTLARSEVLANGGGALTTLGSFNMSEYKGKTGEFGFAPLPAGPEGRKTTLNGLSDAIYNGSKHKDEAWKWVSYLASPACQDTVAKTGVVFPALKEATEKAVAARTAEGLNASIFQDELKTQGGTFSIPISYHGTEISQIVQDAIQSIALGGNAQSALAQANSKVNALFK